MTAAQHPARNGVISANSSPGRRVTPTCVVPGSTASCAFGRSSHNSTMSGNGEKSRSPKISMVGTCSDRSSSVHPGNSCTIVDVLAANSSKCAGSGATAALGLDGDHLPARRKGFEQRTESEVDSHEATVEQDEWPAGTAGLVVKLQAVHRCVRHARWERVMRGP